jgi:transposase-like protein
MTYKKQSIEQKLAIVLRYMNDYAHAEVEQKNGISNGEISNWVRRHQQEGQNGLESKK